MLFALAAMQAKANPFISRLSGKLQYQSVRQWLRSYPVVCLTKIGRNCPILRGLEPKLQPWGQEPFSESSLIVRSILRSMMKCAGSQKKKFTKRLPKLG